MTLSTALLCLAMNIHMEARSEPVIGQYAVAMVTMNRAGWNDKHVCDTVFQKNQFSWANGKAKKVAGVWQINTKMASRLTDAVESEAWERSKLIAKVVLDRRMIDVSRGADHYHANYVKPKWAFKMDHVHTIGKHIFYRRTA